MENWATYMPWKINAVHTQKIDKDMPQRLDKSMPRKMDKKKPRKMDKSYAPENGQHFIYEMLSCPEKWTELNEFLCPEYWTGK